MRNDRIHAASLAFLICLPLQAQIVLQPPTTHTVISAGGSGALEVTRTSDVDGDCDRDIVAFRSGQNAVLASVYTLVNDAVGNFTYPGFMSVGTSSPTTGHLLLDLDGNGRDELVVGRSGGNIFVYADNNNAALNTWVTPPVSYSITNAVVEDMEQGDVTGDGLADVVVVSVFLLSCAIDVFPGDGAGGLGAPITTIVSTLQQSIELGDIDGDGDLDAVTVDTANFQLLVHPNLGTGAFAAPIALSTGAAQPSDIALGDLDLDGDLDIAQADSLGLRAWLNNGGYPDVITVGTNTVDVRLNAGGPAGPVPAGGLATSVNGGIFNAAAKTFAPGDSLAIGTEVLSVPCAGGAPAAILVNLQPESLTSAVTPLGGSGNLPGFELHHPFSSPSGTAYVLGDSLGLLASGVTGFFPLSTSSLVMGQPAFTIPSMPGLPSGYTIRAQGLYFVPVPHFALTLGVAATNVVVLTAQ